MSTNKTRSACYYDLFLHKNYYLPSQKGADEGNTNPRQIRKAEKTEFFFEKNETFTELHR